MSLAAHYKTLWEEELLELHQSGKMAESSYPVLEAELLARGISVPSRSKDWEPGDEGSFFMDHWRGTRPLYSAFWMLYLFVAKAFLLLMGGVFALVRDFAPNMGDYALLTITAYLAFATVAVWRCSPNTSHWVWKWLAQGLTCAYSLLFAYMAVQAFMHG